MARNTITMVIAMVASAVSGAAAGPAPSGVRKLRSKPMGITVTAISMMTVPATVGVTTRRSTESREEIRNWNSDDATIRVASSPGPPRRNAATDTAMKTPEVPMSRMYPAPILPSGRACNMVEMPHTTSAANAAQAR